MSETQAIRSRIKHLLVDALHRIEARVLRAAWGAPALLALEGEHFGPATGFAEPDPAAGVTPRRGGARQIPSRVLLTGLACCGGAAWLVLERTS